MRQHRGSPARSAGSLRRLVSDAYAPSWWTLADAEGNEADVSTWLDRE